MAQYDPIRSPFAGNVAGTVHTATDGRDILLNDPDGWEVDAPWLWWDGPADSDGTGGPFGNPPPGALSPAAGLGLPAVSRCLQLTADKTASMPWKTYRGRDRIEPPAWLVDPQNTARDGRRAVAAELGVRFSGVDFWSQHLRSMILLGEGITYTPRVHDDAGEPTGPIVAPLYNLNPRYLELTPDGRFAVADPDFNDPEAEYPGWLILDSRELLITRWVVRPGYRRGLGVIEAHAADLGFAEHVRSFADNIFERGVPNGYLQSTKPDLTQTQADTLKSAWMRAHGGDHKSIAVLNATTEFHPIDINPQTMQYVDMKRLNAWEIALIFGVPPGKLGVSMGGSMQYSTLEMANADYVQDTLLPIATKLEAAVDAVLPAGTTLKVDFRGLLRGDTTTRYNAYGVALDKGFMTLDEVRDAEDLPPLTAAPAPIVEPPAPDATPAPAQSTPTA
jgi:HK97 family phage portal protein